MAAKLRITKSFGKRSGLKVSAVSIGAMRFPQDDDEAVSLIRQAIDAGFIYIDTSRGYVDSEPKLAKALKDGYREKVILSTKWSPWNLRVEPDDDINAESTYKRIRESMQRLDVDL
ncbi:MAG: aldo/keto reductase [Phycisphaerae bacterium]|nr:aldo/keto reductase [Phycisphaerae bacterium]